MSPEAARAYARSLLTTPAARDRFDAATRLSLAHEEAEKAKFGGFVAQAIDDAWELTKLTADVVNWPLEYFSLGAYDVGASRRLDDVGRGLAEYAQAPIETTFEVFHQIELEIERLEMAGDLRGANELRGRRAFQISSAGAGTAAIAKRLISSGLRNTERVRGTASERGEALTAREGGGAEDLFERRMELIADNDFGPLNRPTHADFVASAGDYVVTFGGARMPGYVDSPSATLGGPGGTVWVMPLDDAGRLRSRADVVTQTGRAPGVTESLRTGAPMYGLAVPTNSLALRSARPTDAGANAHYREGGFTGVQRQDGWYQNPTREFIVDGGRPMPPGSAFFEFAPDGSWIPIRRFP